MGGIGGAIGGLFSGLPSWGKLLINIGVTVGLDLLSALLQPGQQGPRLRDLQYSSSAYGGSIPRCRGTVRLPGNIIWGTPIQETQHSSGGNTTYTYKVALAIAFARGPAVKVLTIYVDGKRLMTLNAPDASMTGVVTTLDNVAGNLNVTLVTAAGASLTLSTGTIIQFGEDPGVDYQVQNPLTLGPSSQGIVGVWPPLAVNLTGLAITIPGLQGPVWDNTWFQGTDSDGNLVQGSCSIYLGNGTQVGGVGVPGTQLPDPVMTSYQGAGNVPAYRDLVYIVLNNFQLINAGNRVPMFSAEIAFDSTTANYPSAGPILNAAGSELSITLSGIDGIIVPASNVGGGPAMGQLPYVFVYVLDGSSNFGQLHRINSQTNIWEGSIYLPPAQYATPVVDYDGFVYVHWAIFGVGNRLDKFDALTGAWISGVPNLSPPEFGVGLYNKLYLIDDLATGAKRLAAAGTFGGIDIFDRAYVYTSSPADLVTAFAVGNVGGTAWSLLTDLVALAGPDAGIVGDGSIATVTMGGGAPGIAMTADKYGNLWYGQGSTVVGVSLTSLGIPSVFVTYSSLGIGADITGLIYNPTDNSLLVSSLDGTAYHVDCVSGTVLGTYSGGVGGAGSIGVTAADNLGTAMLGQDTGWQRVQIVSLVAGATPAVTTYAISSWGSFTGLPGVYDLNSDSMWINSSGAIYRLYLDRGAPGEVNLADVIGWLCQEAGLLSTDYDVTLVTGGIGGVQFDRQAVRDNLLQLMTLGPMDAAEIDGVLRFVPRGGSSIFAIPEADLGALDATNKSERRVSELLQQEIDTPYRVTLKYYDGGRDYQQAAQDARRISQPYASDLVDGRKVMNSRNEFEITLPITWDATSARQAAEKLLYDFWVSRFTYDFKTSLKWLRLDPADVGTITYQGVTFTVRLTEADRGAGFALQFKAADSDAAIYSSVLPSDTGTVTAPPLQPPQSDPVPGVFIPRFYINGNGGS